LLTKQAGLQDRPDSFWRLTLQNRRSGFSAESRLYDFIGKCGGLPTAATMDGSFAEVSYNTPPMNSRDAKYRGKLPPLCIVCACGSLRHQSLIGIVTTENERP